MNNNFFTFLQEFYGSLSIPLLICAVIFFIGLTLLFWTLFISEGKKRTKLIKCLIFGGVSIAAYILLWYLYVSLFPEESGVRPNILSLIIVPATGCMMMAVVSLVLVLFKYRKNERAYLIPLSLFVVGLILIASKTFVYAFLNDSILDFFSSVFSLKFRSISPFELIKELMTNNEGFGTFNLNYALITSICICVAGTFWLWTRFVSEGEKQKKLWLLSRISLAIFILNVGVCVLQIAILMSQSETDLFVLMKFFLPYFLLLILAIGFGFFGFWTRFASEGEKRKTFWIFGGVSIAILVFLGVSCFFKFKGSSMEAFFNAFGGSHLLFLLSLLLLLCFGLSAIVSLWLVLWKCRKNRRAYLIPLILLIASFIFGLIYIAIYEIFFLCIFYFFWILVAT